MRGFDFTNPPPTERDPFLTAETRFITAEFCSTWARRIVKCSLKIPSKADEEVPNINFVFDVKSHLVLDAGRGEHTCATPQLQKRPGLEMKDNWVKLWH